MTRDIIGFLGGGEGTEEESGQLTAEWIEYRTVVPGESDRVARREVFDLLGPAARSAGTVPTAALTDRQRLDRALAFLGDTRILPLASWLSPQYVRWLNARAALDNRESLLTLSRSDPERDAAAISRVFSKLTPAPGPLYELALARHEWSADGDDVFLAEANVLTYRNTVRAGADGAVEGVEGFDIVASNVAVRPSATRDAMEARIRQGALDANAEALLARACCGGSIQATAEAFASADRAGTSWVTLRTKDAAARAQWPEDVRARIAADLDAGYVVVAPAALSAGTVSWWRIDPRTGNTLAMARTGWGGALAEAAVQNLRILLQIEAFVVCGIKIQTARDWSAAKKAALLVACSAVAYFGIGNVAMGSTALTKALWLSVAKDLTGLIAVNGVTMFM